MIPKQGEIQVLDLLEDNLKNGVSVTFTAKGNSMHPYLRNGTDRVTVLPFDGIFQKNQIYFYRRTNGQYILHRLIKIRSDRLYFCGDHQFYMEEIKKEQVLGQLACAKRGKKEISLSGFRTALWCFFLPIRRFSLHLLEWILRKMNKILPK